jgi:hypothetical protein
MNDDVRLSSSSSRGNPRGGDPTRVGDPGRTSGDTRFKAGPPVFIRPLVA